MATFDVLREIKAPLDHGLRSATSTGVAATWLLTEPPATVPRAVASSTISLDRRCCMKKHPGRTLPGHGLLHSQAAMSQSRYQAAEASLARSLAARPNDHSAPCSLCISSSVTQQSRLPQGAQRQQHHLVFG